MLRRALRLFSSASCLALLLAFGAPLLGCSKDKLVQTEVPAEGLTLEYALAPGATFDGYVKRREVLTNRGNPINRKLEFTVQLVVNRVDEEGNARVAATVSNIVIDWNLPGVPVSMAEFNAQARQRLEGVTIPFSVDPQGRVSDIPAAPPELSDAEVGVLDSLVEGLTSAFFVVPDKQLQAGETWEESDTRGREGKLGKYVEEVTRGTLVGLFVDPESQQRLAKLEIESDKTATTTTQDGSSETRTRSAVTVLFDVENNYMASIDSTLKRWQGPSSTEVQFDATWTRTIAGAGGASSTGADTDADADAGSEPDAVQRIDDPCDDNYVGPEECLDPCSTNYMGDEPCKEDGEASGPEQSDEADDGEEAEDDGDGAESDEAASDETASDAAADEDAADDEG